MKTAIFAVVILVMVLYLVFILVQIGRLLRLKTFTSTAGFLTPPQLLVLVPFCNEGDNLKRLLPLLAQQSFEARFMELVFINDHSTDNGDAWLSEQIKEYDHMRLVHANEHGKKSALLKGMEGRSMEYVVTLDADCSPDRDWLKTTSDAIIALRPDMLILPMVEIGEGLANYLRSIDFLSLMGMTASFAQAKKPLMANGGNLAFSKAAFDSVGGYESHRHISSGDDIYFLQALHEKAESVIEYVLHPSTIVPTQTATSWRAFFTQRARWGSKTKAMGVRASLIAMLAGAVVLLQLTVGLFCVYLDLSWWLFIGVWGVKAGIDFVFLAITANKLGQKEKLWVYPISALIYPFTLLIIALHPKSKLKWKSRSVKVG